jgi:outer membrane protein OmpA-like peptidoglycan-associated protein
MVLALMAALAVGCGSSQSSSSDDTETPPATASGGETTETTQTTETTETASAPAHAEAHMDHGHITLEHQIQFETQSDHIQEDASRGPLDELIAVFRENPQIRKVRIEGHADVRGSAAINQDLSQRRAAAVAAYLRSHGLSNIEFEPVGYGASQRLCTEDTDACHDRNRRVEFTVTEPAAN